MDLLRGITVLDFSHVLSGPYCTMLLADYGADVLKVERPGEGDVTRAWGPPFFNGESAYFLSINRNKRSLTIDLKTNAGKQLARDLAKKADVLVENFSPGTMTELGLDYPALRTLNPRLVYCSISGFGQTGPDRDLPGFDLVIQARGGMMSITGPAEGPPSIAGIAIADLFSGLHAQTAILSALIARQTSGTGCYLDFGLLDSQVNILSHQATSFLNSGKVPSRRGNSHNNIVPYQTFKTRDGHINIAVGNEKLWRSFCKVLNVEPLAADPRFATNAKRVENRAALLAQLEPLIAQRDNSGLLRELNAAHIPAAPVQDMAAVFSDPQVLARQMVAEMQHPTAGTVKVPHAPGFIDGKKPALRRPPPRLGEHTDEILREKLGLSDERLRELRELKAIH